MADIKISIIVPIYNVELYLAKCLDSLVNQTMKEIEIILVNDASPDASREIMEEYRAQFPGMIRCIYHEENLGPGGARNTGIRYAKGEYVLFIDGDDYVDITLCEKLYDVAERNGSDIVCCESKEGVEGKFKEVDQYSTQVMGELDYEKRRLLISVHFVGPVAKIIRRNLLIENQLYFPENMKYEDSATIPLWWVYAKRFDEVQEPLYYYIRREGSITKTKNSMGYYDLFKAAKYLYQQFLDRGLQAEYQECMDNILLRGFVEEIKLLLKNVDKPDKKELQKLKKDVLELIPNYAMNPLLYMGEEPKAVEGAKLLMRSVEEFCDVLTHHQISSLESDYTDYYKNGRNRCNALLDYCKNCNYKVAVWGAGGKGKDFLSVVDSEATCIPYVIDKNEKRWNQKLDTGHTITDFYSISEQIDVVLVMNKVYFGSIYREVKKKDKRIKVLNLDLMLMSDIIRDMEEFME